MSYDGPGLYQHYKGGEYTVIGVTEHESTGQKTVVYFSHDAGRTAERASRGVDFINRPLNKDDGLDAWNVPVHLVPENAEPLDVPRFVKHRGPEPAMNSVTIRAFEDEIAALGARGDRMAQAVEALLTPATPRETLVFLRQLGDPEIDAMLEKMGFG